MRFDLIKRALRLTCARYRALRRWPAPKTFAALSALFGPLAVLLLTASVLTAAMPLHLTLLALGAECVILCPVSYWLAVRLTTTSETLV